MEGENGSAEQYAFPVEVGEKLRLAREEKGLSISQVAAATRITERHLELIEAGDFGALPARTYAIGFSRSYAKFLELDESEIVREVREELSAIGMEEQNRAGAFEPGDPGRVPSAKLAWFSAAVGIAIFIAGSFFLWSSFISPAGDLPWLTRDRPAPSANVAQGTKDQPPAAQAQAAKPSGQVVFTSKEEGIWVKFYDSSGKQLMQKQMALGESYSVPADANGPQIWTGRPDALAITIGGKPVAPLAERERIMKDVPVTAQALLDRETTPTPSPPTA